MTKIEELAPYMRSTTAHSDEKTDLTNESLSQTELRQSDFQKISQIVYQFSGIRFNTGKEELVRSRLMKRLRALSLHSFSAYLRYVNEDRTSQELRTMIDCLTTNKTSFFREKQHFDYLGAHILPDLKKRAGLRIWSAGCSSGEEPYSIAMLLHDEWADIQADVRILATDISERVLSKAATAEYERESILDVPPAYLLKYFTTTRTGSSKTYTVQDNIKKMVRFARLNLMDEWPMKRPFDVIFCRNVMIYFDSATQRQLVQRFCEMLVPGGHLLVGHSESLVANSTGFKYIQPATYMKQNGDERIHMRAHASP
jgi:chemotaxis protein methyltransferase CheR